MRDQLLNLLREAWYHGEADAITYAEERSTRSLARMNDSYANEAWTQWQRLHEDEIELLLEGLQ